MKAPVTVKTWEKTRLQNLVRHKSGGYYARLFLNGKEVWRSLKTKHFSIAQARLATATKEHQQRRALDKSPSDAAMTFGQAAELHIKRLDVKVSIKTRTRKYWREIHAAILKSWPALVGTEVRKITTSACRDWAARYAQVASPTRYNNSIAFLCHVLALAIESGVIVVNVASELERKPVKQKKLELPSLAQFHSFIKEMAAPRIGFTQHSADFAEGLAYTGCRLTEGGRIAWQDLNFITGEIKVLGDPEEGTKNGEIRIVPMIPSARALFTRMRAKRPDEAGDAPVFQVRECQKSMDRAAKAVGMKRITHHDLRHFFATVCIESGVDIPTVSRWLGHKDGGALAMRTYGHLRREHSIAQALKVSFQTPAPA